MDPGCAFANDDTETSGNFAAGVSPPVNFALPRLSDIQGHGATTPYPEEGVQAMTADPAEVIVTRIASDGFYATDVTDRPIQTATTTCSRSRSARPAAYACAIA